MSTQVLFGPKMPRLRIESLGQRKPVPGSLRAFRDILSRSPYGFQR